MPVATACRRMAQHRPISVVEGLNHALLSNAKPGPLDLPSDAPQGPLLVAVARCAVRAEGMHVVRALLLRSGGGAVAYSTS